VFTNYRRRSGILWQENWTFGLNFLFSCDKKADCLLPFLEFLYDYFYLYAPKILSKKRFYMFYNHQILWT
jgi:hypothetical protein